MLLMIATARYLCHAYAALMSRRAFMLLRQRCAGFRCRLICFFFRPTPTFATILSADVITFSDVTTTHAEF